MKIRSKLIAAVCDYLSADHTVPVPVHRETGDNVLDPPYAVVRISSGEPIAPGEPVWGLTLLIAVFHVAGITPPEDAELAAEKTFAPVDFQPRAGETNEEAAARVDAFAAFAATKGLAISAMYPEDSQMAAEDGRWSHITGFQVIAAEI